VPCFGGADVAIRGWLDTPPTMGFEPPDIEPTGSTTRPAISP
jgi:hypothetical protein